MIYSRECWDEGAPALIEAAAQFDDDEEAILAALELACNHQGVELRRGHELIAYLRHTKNPLRPKAGAAH